MKKILTYSLILYSITLVSQEQDKEIKIDEEGWNKRISFFVGAGTSFIVDKVYEFPVIDKTNNNVIIEESGRLKPNVSLGIVYTPLVYDVERFINYYDSDGNKKVKKIKRYKKLKDLLDKGVLSSDEFESKITILKSSSEEFISLKKTIVLTNEEKNLNDNSFDKKDDNDILYHMLKIIFITFLIFMIGVIVLTTIS